jgi:GrpB-like predicted nucleotidyltransferase (UPF0157 family)
VVEALGLESGIVRVVEYDPRWPALFAAERQRILDHCGALALALEHVGGTSIPGLCAKPVLDIAAGRPRDASLESCVGTLERAGYEHRGERGVPGRQFFRRGKPRAYHVHLVEEGGALWREYLAFRDYLRAHAEAARRFADLKRNLAARFPRDREAYMNAKSPHVQEILRLAGQIAPKLHGG